jgi:hypothetical protein
MVRYLRKRARMGWKDATQGQVSRGLAKSLAAFNAKTVAAIVPKASELRQGVI